MSELKDETPEVIAKELTIALIEKTGSGGPITNSVQNTCDAFDKIYKQVIKTVRGN